MLNSQATINDILMCHPTGFDGVVELLARGLRHHLSDNVRNSAEGETEQNQSMSELENIKK
jgi:hypothetical protein